MSTKTGTVTRVQIPNGMDGFDGDPGEDGADGITPHIGTNGNWYIGTTDTGVAATAGAEAAEAAAAAAETAKADAVSAKTAAASSASAAQTAKTAAETAQSEAESAKTAAAKSETNAKTSETNAGKSATAAASSATAASNSATAAATSETNAKTSETNAASSASSASSSKTAAETAAAQAQECLEEVETKLANGEFDGADGQRGTGILKVTTAPSSYTTAIGSYTPKYRIALSTVKAQAKVDEVLLGDLIQYSFYQYLVDHMDATYAYTSVARTSIRGAAGTTPVKGTDYWTEADKQEVQNESNTYIATELAKRGQLQPEFANSIEECTDTTKLYVLPDGMIYAYMTGKGTAQGSEVLNIVWNDNCRLSTSDGGLRTGATGYTASADIDLSVLANVGDTLTVTGLSFDGVAHASRSIVTKVNGAFSKADFVSANTTYKIPNDGASGVSYVADTSLTTVTFTRTAANTDGKTYAVALCGYGSGANAVVTRTGEVEMDGVMTWASTGHAFVPADYENRIVALEADNTALKNDNTALKTRVKALEDAAVYGDGVPDYVLTEAEEVADKVLTVRNADSFVMGLASDLHTDGTDTSSVGVLHAGQGMDIINSMTQLDLVALLGDYEIYGFSYGDGDTDGEDARVSFKHAKKAFSSVAKGAPFMMLQGNHDELPADTTEEARQKYYAYIGANNVGVVTDAANRFRNYGYRDFDDQKIRVIYLNTVDVSDGDVTGSCNVSTEQLNWLNTVALNLADSDWGIIVLSHHPLNWDGMSGLLNALNTYKGNGAGAELIAHFHGHLHNFRAETLGTNAVPTITIPNACFGRNNEYGTASSYSDAIKTAFGDTDSEGNQRQFNKTANTAEDTAFNVVVVDRASRKIHAFCYGAGIDREISY